MVENIIYTPYEVKLKEVVLDKYRLYHIVYNNETITTSIKRSELDRICKMLNTAFNNGVNLSKI